MTAGLIYEVQVWSSDNLAYDPSDPSASAASTYTAGNSVSLQMEVGTGGPGQYAIGVFTVDAATQDYGISTNSGWAEVNALQIRAVPEPSSTALLGIGGLALILRPVAQMKD